jgi:hypothetical protein
MDRAQFTPMALEPPVVDEVVDDLMAGAAKTPIVAPPDQAEAIEGPDEPRDEADPRPWRGVFAVEYRDEVLFTKRIDIRPDQLDEWRPEPATGRGHGEQDD